MAAVVAAVAVAAAVVAVAAIAAAVVAVVGSRHESDVTKGQILL